MHDSKESLMKLMNKKELIITCGDAEKVVKLLSDFDTKLLPGSRAAITYDPSQTPVEEILKVLAQSEVEIKDISTSQPDLEDIFKYLLKAKSD